MSRRRSSLRLSPAMLSCSLALATLLSATGTALAQKSDPQPLQPYVEPQLDIGLWARAYELANRPRLLVLAGFGTDRHQVMDPGQILSNLDSTSITHKIRAALISELNTPGADIELVDDNALRAAMTRLTVSTNTANEVESTEILRQLLGADQVILVRLTDSGVTDSLYSVVVESSDLARGRRGATFPFDWKGGADVANIKANARAMAIGYVDDFAMRVNNPVRYTVQLLGLQTVDMQAHALDSLNALRGLRGQVRTRTGGTVTGSASARSESFVEYEVTFVRGADTDTTQIVAEITDLLRDRHNMLAEPVQSEAGRIALRVRPGTGGITATPIVPNATSPAIAAPAKSIATTDSAASTDVEPSPANPGLSEELRALYTARGSPRMLVMLNRAATIGEVEDWNRSSGTTGGNVIVATTPGSASAENTDQPGASAPVVDPSALEAWSRQVEQSLSESLSTGYGLTRQVSGDLARASLLTRLAPGQKYLSPDQFIALLQKEDVADIAVVGTGKVVSGIAGHELVYNFETVELATGRRIGAAIFTAPVRDLTETDALRRSSTSFASRAEQQAASTLKDAWSAPATMTISIRGIAGDEEVQLLKAAVWSHSTKLVFTGTASFKPEGERGVATFSATFSGPSDQIGAELQRIGLAAALPFRLEVTAHDAAAIAVDARR